LREKNFHFQIRYCSTSAVKVSKEAEEKVTPESQVKNQTDDNSQRSFKNSSFLFFSFQLRTHHAAPEQFSGNIIYGLRHYPTIDTSPRFREESRFRKRD
jgi:hypothetical protein